MSAKRKTLKTTSAPKCEVGPNGFRTGYMPNGDFVERVMDDGKESPLILRRKRWPISAANWRRHSLHPRSRREAIRDI